LKVYEVSKRVVSALKNRFWYGFAGHKIRPKLLVLEATRRCNSRCKICDTWKVKAPVDELSVREIDTILSDGLFSDLENVILTGGEPSLRADLFEIIEAINKRVPKVAVWISTNGLLPVRILSVVKKCLEQKISVGVGVSLDGVGEKHDHIRGIKGAYEKARYLLRKLKELELNPTVGFTLSELTAENYLELKKAIGEEFPLLVQKFDCSGFYNTEKRAMNVLDSERKIVDGLPNTLLRNHWIRQLNGETRTFSCFALHSFFVLRSNGDVSPCLRNYDMICGNMREEKPSALWKRIGVERGYVKRCDPQCLNDWAFRESMKSAYFPLFWFKLKKGNKQEVTA
jgi:MoaA/NifB/PqqE/SkfB family radical SAM enzyme